MDRAIGERVKGCEGSPYEKRTGTVSMIKRRGESETKPSKHRGSVVRVHWYGSVADSPVRPEWIEEN